MIAQPVAAPGRMRDAQGQDLLNGLRWGREGMRFVDGWEVFEPFQSVGLDAAFVFVKLGAWDVALPAGFGRIAEHFCQLQNTQTMMGYFFFCGHVRSLRIGFYRMF